ncbi:LysR family transcriptional regulator [Stenotrophomonas maltophilia]|uniref:LysR family transcriptional regulator n=2 Tax=Stenotrophomonas maltophilia TaxID=40324 RepID=UPI0009B2E618|nr:LysR family transcriptional regulator [Stenotrophomonas maltophilia]MBN7831733.1 LysR family transcriptional regulator [Stenotrophomonas maltophilia]MBN7833557.1 LysR family transcriptional regulator [Stenotrophomonas maltophilia]MBN7859968.1 LysR family transcriptional regulator [Stenotrophomonas maltophilia]MBN7916397.1 LysR family transcriptional regulator [Stenotrophomonas maltophilia]MBO2846692.1 LysR family transcriptional regulator [Stenotrophomonas maltophilia]
MNLRGASRALDPALLEMLVCIASEGSFTRAADKLNLTQQAISAQVKRLEQIVGRVLVDRSKTGARLTQFGEALLEHARLLADIGDSVRRQFESERFEGSVRIGIASEFGDSRLEKMLFGLRERHPLLELRCTIGRTSELLLAYQAALLDTIVGAQRSGDALGEVIFREELVWAGESGGLPSPGAALRLVLCSNPSFIREEVIRTLTSLKRQWIVTFESESELAVQAAVRSHWGVTAAPRGALHAGIPCIELDHGAELPALGSIEYFLLHRRASGAVSDTLLSLLRDPNLVR